MVKIRIDIAAADFSKEVSWGTDDLIKAAMDKLKLDADAEAFWKNHEEVCRGNNSFEDEVTYNVEMFSFPR
ncbi:hypothetical protein [Paenibacillus agricola]|uniref:Uncharacterized protein n=1 Tax=Paenibacillus agricola TaxID=2716264 RepID=A0ABX0JKX9_9BACL|nr:hypothetical protein [Paenibacillus agricola]NHN34620.1 hypothetical protein [Paenibacillus agricola]